MPPTLTPAGPLFGPDAVVFDTATMQLGVRVYPDARNGDLAAAALPTRFYVEPPALFLARRDTGELDFAMSALVKRGPAPEIEYVGGTCTFATTSALPDAVFAEVGDRLVGGDHPEPPARLAPLFRCGRIAPELQPIPISRSTISCVLAQPPAVAAPLPGSIQFQREGSLESAGRNTFLVTCGPATAAEFVDSLRRRAAPPLLLAELRTEQFDTGAATLVARVSVAVDRLCTDDADPEDRYRASLARGAIEVVVTDHTGKQVEQGLRAWISRSEPIKQAVFALAGPRLRDTAAVEPGGRQPAGLVLRDSLELHGAIALEHTVTAQFGDLVAAVTEYGTDKYLTVLDIGGY
ncbi:hypothetical protein [Nocardia sp. NPDC049149]|uniref:hypothetical protein n=1 Tax=Nocardia sp. NPDC049149 TaxID=3364315 RepID=UPI003715EBBD